LTPIYVVIGAGRPLGAALVRRLAGEGKAVRAIVLKGDRVRSFLPDSVEVTGVSPDGESVRRACGDADVIFNCFEPHGSKWGKVVAEITSKVLLTTIETGARFILASYLFASESDNWAAEQDVLDTHRTKFAKTLIARFPQIYGPGVQNALLTQVFEAVMAGKKAYWMGKLDAPCSWVYVEDAASALALLSRTEKAYGKTWNIAGPGPLSGRQFLELAFSAARRDKKIGVRGRGIMLTASLLDSRARALLDLPHDYYSPLVVDGETFVNDFPSFQYTAHDVAMAQTLEWYSTEGGRQLEKIPA
jgi:nucleoside-diphosphate-sugar epimerase